ncbi:MAG: hypothetical protein GY771_10270 [bacterium]|nr:hypothetical protein [bacterium]
MYGITKLSSESDYKKYYIDNYCKTPVKTIDGIEVNFPEPQFGHAFYRTDRSTSKKTSVFDPNRGEKIDWIRDVLTDASTQIYEGKPGTVDRQVYLNNSYVIVVREVSSNNPQYVTSFPADASAISKIITNKKIK